MSRFALLRFLPLIAFAIAGCAAPKTAPAVLTIDSAPQQTIRGWGIYPCTIRNDRPNAQLYTLWKRPNAARLIWRDLGATYWRSEILPGSYDARRDDGSLDVKYLDESLVRQIKLAKSYGQTRYILSVWSPPAPFKSPATTLGVDPKTKRVAVLRPDREADYCRFIVRVLKHLQTEKLPLPFAFSVQNEPNYAPDLWNGTQLTPAQWQRLTIEMRAELDKSGFKNIEIIGPEGGSYRDSVEFVGGVAASALSNPQFDKALGGYAFHGYTRLSKYQPDLNNLRNVALKMQKSGKPVWQSEWSIPSDTPDALDHVLQTAQRLGRETAFVPCNYWSWWQGYYPRHPKGEVLITGPDDDNLHISKTYTFLQCLWKNAPAGSIVHRINSSDAQLSGFDADKVQCVAFENGARQTVLLVNPTNKIKPIEVRSLQAATATPYLTDQTRDMTRQAPIAVVNGVASWVLPARSACVLVTP